MNNIIDTVKSNIKGVNEITKLLYEDFIRLLPKRDLNSLFK